MYKLVHKLKNLKGPLKSLNRNDFDDIENNAARARMYLESIQEKLRIDPNNPDLIHMEIEAASSVRFLEDACYTFLVQKSKVTWVDKGDSNNRYFHSVIKTRQVRSKIMKIEDTKGVLCEDITQIQNAFLDFYTDLLGTSTSVTKVSQHVVQLGNLCSEDHHAILFLPSPMMRLNRLAQILPHIISDSQGGFIKGRSIVENILICQDVIRCYKRKSVSPRFMLKVDLKKAYDSVNWDFLEQMLTYLNFPPFFIHLIMECTRSASYSLVLNGESFRHFKGAKGLRQGDPLSPLLFTIAMEYLSRILAYTTATFPFKFHPLCSPLRLSHLMFADDLLLFCKGDVKSIMVILRFFSTFSHASGLQMNPTKTNAFFNGVPSDVKHEILQISGVQEGLLPFRSELGTNRLNTWCIPKHQFIAWLVAREALLLKERSFVTRKIFDELGQLLDVALPATDLVHLIDSGQHSKLKKGVLLCAVLVAQYHIWIQRNQARVAGCILRPTLVVSQIMKLLKMRVGSRLQPNLVSRDVMWLSSVKLHM
ncbi:uncharacterized protein LOC141590096 [Silene latifolia]|uniref:uncharacterized protein LOC141590096 n=1 Tax=Silene latifolia TaxID=37657 RepID=UPI003D76EBF5